MTKTDKNIYVCVGKLGQEKNAKQKSVRNGSTSPALMNTCSFAK